LPRGGGGGGRILLGGLGRDLLGHPLLEVLGRVDRHEALHPEVAEAAELGARDLPVPDVIALEPDARLHAGNGVLLDAEFRQEERVDHVLGGQRRDDGLADREVELVERHDVVGGVELPVRSSVADVPCELLAGDVDLEGLVRHVLLHLRPDPPRQEGQHHADQRRDDRPDDLEPVVPVRVMGRPAFAVAVLEEEEQQESFDDHEDDPRDPHDQVEDRVDLVGEGRRLLRQVHPERQRRGGRRGEGRREKEKRRPESPGGARESDCVVHGGIDYRTIP